MSRRKYPENKKKKRFTITINKDIAELFDEYIIKNNIYNKSEFIEELIKKQLSNLSSFTNV